MDGGTVLLNATINNTGSYLILDPPTGGFDLYCTAEGYNETRVSGISVGANSEVNHNFFLEVSEVPEAPVLTATTSGTTVSISWSRISNAAGYRLFYAPVPYSGSESIGSVDMGNKTGISVDLWKGASFYLSVTAYNSSGISGYSNIVHFQIK